MMILEDKIKQLNRLIESAKNNSIRLSKELERLRKKIGVEDDDLLNNITTYVEVNKHESKTYEYILGGDGRSSPWSEKRNGVVVELKEFDDYYLTDEQKVKVNKILRITHSADKVYFLD